MKLDGRVLTANRNFLDLFGYALDEVIGKPVYVLIPPDREKEEPYILRLIASGERLDHFRARPFVVEALADRDPKLRCAGLEAVRAWTEAERVEAATRALMDGEASVRSAATSQSSPKRSVSGSKKDEDDVLLDPTQPESLVYTVDGDERIQTAHVFGSKGWWELQNRGGGRR